MLGYTVRRIALSLFVVLGVVTLVFFLSRLSGDPAMLYLPERATPQQIAALRHRLGLDRPLAVQYVLYLDRVVHLDLGNSLRHGRPATRLVFERMGATLQLAAFAFVVSLAISVPLGILSAIYKDTPIDTAARLLALVGQCTPIFWLGVVLILVFAVRLHLFPTSGRGGLVHLVLPGVTLGTYSAGLVMRILRAEIIAILGQDYIRTAWAKGLNKPRVYLRHVLKNAGIPVLTLVGLQLGYLLSGAVITEFVFAYPGMGRLALAAILERDFAVVQVFTIFSGFIMTTINLVVDLLYAWFDPRIRFT
jgi:ABC-type dipeptide/oligopeptide/nickel transport system permease component